MSPQPPPEADVRVQRRRGLLTRGLAVVLWVSVAGLLVAGFVEGAQSHGVWGGVILVAMATTIGSAVLLMGMVQPWGLRGDHELDERQRQVRDRAFRRAYEMLGPIVVVPLMTAAFLGHLLGLRLAGAGLQVWGVAIMGLWFGFPSALIAWGEPRS